MSATNAAASCIAPEANPAVLDIATKYSWSSATASAFANAASSSDINFLIRVKSIVSLLVVMVVLLYWASTTGCITTAPFSTAAVVFGTALTVGLAVRFTFTVEVFFVDLATLPDLGCLLVVVFLVFFAVFLVAFFIAVFPLF